MGKNKKLSIVSKELTLVDIVQKNIEFNIPIYQRLYVWGKEQIETLLGDLSNAFHQKSDKFYFGGIMLSKNDEKSEKYDLVDGQQRFTTLWLLSKNLGGELSRFTYSRIGNIDVARISFSVRDFANAYLKDPDLSFTEDEKEELKQIDEAQKIIEKYLNDEIQDREAFSRFIFEKVLFVETLIPPETDENKVFEAMNNRGVQLQQHEILKNRLLQKIKDNSLRNKYSLLWDACSIMDNYLERNIKVVANLQWMNLFSETKTELEEGKAVELPSDILDRITHKDNGDSVSLKDILAEDLSEKDKVLLDNASQQKTQDDKYEYDSGTVRSIITFPMLLLHTLRIYEYRNDKVSNANLSAEVKGKELIRIFGEKDYFREQDDVETFIMLLWNIRKQFDRFVIKWVSNEDNTEETHLIKRLYQNKSAFQRKEPKTNEKFALLQSMLYHSQQITTLYWLTPFLNKLLNDKGEAVVQDKNQLHSFLEHLDNEMFCNEKRDLRTMSYELMKKSSDDLKGDLDYVTEEFEGHKGVSYPRYWFYKLEYVLWKYRDDFDREETWKDYRMTAKNSVEHISPQNPKSEDVNIVYSESDDDYRMHEKQDDFGNLVLLSPGMNSEYSNKTYNVKRTEFGDKKRLDSLKSDLIFSNDTWNWDLCKKHRAAMINLLEQHLNS